MKTKSPLHTRFKKKKQTLQESMIGVKPKGPQQAFADDRPAAVSLLRIYAWFPPVTRQPRSTFVPGRE